MFTVVICGKQLIDDCFRKYHIYFEPFLNNDDIAFCEWDASADSLETAVPQLKELISQRKEWRAVVVNDNSVFDSEVQNRRNPFDYVGVTKKDYDFSTFEAVKCFRENEDRVMNRALGNPLTRLSIWLCGAPIRRCPPVCYDNDRERLESVDNSDKYFELLDELNLSAVDVEIDRSRERKYTLLRDSFAIRGELFNPPTSFIAIAQRIGDVEEERKRSSWVEHSEFDYSQFYMDNLYPDKLRYLIGDLAYLNDRRNESSYFNFLTALLIIASNDCPNDALRPYRVYRMETQIDAKRVKKLVSGYNAKLLATLNRIDEISKKLNEQESRPLANEEVEENFEAKIKIPIEAVNKDEREEMMAEYGEIGLAKDCPTDEVSYWEGQYRRIGKRFSRFLREPRRRVKTAAKESFRYNSTIRDDRIMRISEYQREDIQYVLNEEEHNMVSTTTTRLFNSAEYDEKIKEANRELNRKISMRMTKKNIIIVGIIAAAAFLAGFLPLLLGNTQTSKAVLVSLTVTLASIAAFLLCGLITLIAQKRVLINRFIHFNMVMSGVLNDIERGVGAFADYLSHACNVMRAFSVLECCDNPYEVKRAILKNHKRIIESKICEANEFFAGYIDTAVVDFKENVQPYDFDFTVMHSYEYTLPYSEVWRDIEFLQEGNTVAVPVDYVKAVTLTREELYD